MLEKFSCLLNNLKFPSGSKSLWLCENVYVELFACIKLHFKKRSLQTSLAVQWLRIHLPTQGTWVQSLVRENSICCGATKPMLHNYWARSPEPRSHDYWSLHALEPAHTSATAMRSPHTAKSSPLPLQPEKALVEQQRPSAVKNKNEFKKKKPQSLLMGHPLQIWGKLRCLRDF